MFRKMTPAFLVEKIISSFILFIRMYKKHSQEYQLFVQEYERFLQHSEDITENIVKFETFVGGGKTHKKVMYYKCALEAHTEALTSYIQLLKIYKLLLEKYMREVRN